MTPVFVQLDPTCLSAEHSDIAVRQVSANGIEIAVAVAGHGPAVLLPHGFPHTRLRVPTSAIGTHPVGNALAAQLRPVAENLRSHLIPDCGHIIPLDRPGTLLSLLTEFIDSSDE